MRESKKANKFRFYFSSHSSQAVTSAGRSNSTATNKKIYVCNQLWVHYSAERALVPFDDFIPLQIIVILFDLGYARPPRTKITVWVFQLKFPPDLTFMLLVVRNVPTDNISAWKGCEPSSVVGGIKAAVAIDRFNCPFNVKSSRDWQHTIVHIASLLPGFDFPHFLWW